MAHSSLMDKSTYWKRSGRRDASQKRTCLCSGKIESKSTFTRGVFVALNDISDPARVAITIGKAPSFFVMNGYDLTMILFEQISLVDFLRKRVRLLGDEGRVCVPFFMSSACEPFDAERAACCRRDGGALSKPSQDEPHACSDLTLLSCRQEYTTESRSSPLGLQQQRGIVMGSHQTGRPGGFYFPKGSHGSKQVCNGCGRPVFAMSDPRTGKQWLYEVWDDLDVESRRNIAHRCTGHSKHPGAHLPSTPEQLRLHAKRAATETAREVLAAKEEARRLLATLQAMREQLAVLRSWMDRQDGANRRLAAGIFRSRLVSERERLDVLAREAEAVVARYRVLQARRSASQTPPPAYLNQNTGSDPFRMRALR